MRNCKNIVSIEKQEQKAATEKLRMETGNRLREWREKSFKTQVAVVNDPRFDCVSDASSWSRWENGEREIPEEVRSILYHDFNVDLNWLYFGEDSSCRDKELKRAVEILARHFKLL